MKTITNKRQNHHLDISGMKVNTVNAVSLTTHDELKTGYAYQHSIGIQCVVIDTLNVHFRAKRKKYQIYIRRSQIHTLNIFTPRNSSVEVYIYDSDVTNIIALRHKNINVKFYYEFENTSPLILLHSDFKSLIARRNSVIKIMDSIHGEKFHQNIINADQSSQVHTNNIITDLSSIDSQMPQWAMCKPYRHPASLLIFETTSEGIVCYKSFKSSYLPNPNWNIEPDSLLIEPNFENNTNESCGPGINVCPTLKDAFAYNGFSRHLYSGNEIDYETINYCTPIWKLIIPWWALSTICLPTEMLGGSYPDKKFRTKYAILKEVVWTPEIEMETRRQEDARTI